MGTTFVEIYEDWMLPIINDYKLDKIYKIDECAVYEFLSVFLKSGLSDFNCLKPLTFKNEKIYNEDDDMYVDNYIFDYELDSDEKKIISEIAVSKYFKRQIQDIKARLPYISQREFKKEATAPIMKENDNWYRQLVSEYIADIDNYEMKHIDKLPYWSDLV